MPRDVADDRPVGAALACLARILRAVATHLRTLDTRILLHTLEPHHEGIRTGRKATDGDTVSSSCSPERKKVMNDERVSLGQSATSPWRAKMALTRLVQPGAEIGSNSFPFWAAERT